MGAKCCASDEAGKVAYDAPVKKPEAKQTSGGLPSSTQVQKKDNILLDAVANKVKNEVQNK